MLLRLQLPLMLAKHSSGDIRKLTTSFIGRFFLLAFILFIRTADAQPTRSVEVVPSGEVKGLTTCFEPKGMVTIVEESEESAARLEAIGLPQKVASLVEGLVRKSGCYALAPDASWKLKVSVTNISSEHTVFDSSPGIVMGRTLGDRIGRGVTDERLITVNTSVYLVSDMAMVESRGQATAQVLFTKGPVQIIVRGLSVVPVGGLSSATKVYNDILLSALGDALNKVIAAHTR